MLLEIKDTIYFRNKLFSLSYKYSPLSYFHPKRSPVSKSVNVLHRLVSERGWWCMLFDLLKFIVCYVVAALSDLLRQRRFLEIISE